MWTYRIQRAHQTESHSRILFAQFGHVLVPCGVGQPDSFGPEYAAARAATSVLGSLEALTLLLRDQDMGNKWNCEE